MQCISRDLTRIDIFIQRALCFISGRVGRKCHAIIGRRAKKKENFLFASDRSGFARLRPGIAYERQRVARWKQTLRGTGISIIPRKSSATAGYQRSPRFYVKSRRNRSWNIKRQRDAIVQANHVQSPRISTDVTRYERISETWPSTSNRYASDRAHYVIPRGRFFSLSPDNVRIPMGILIEPPSINIFCQKCNASLYT